MARRKPWILVVLLLVLVGSGPAVVGAAWWRAHRRIEAILDIPEPAINAAYDEYRRPVLFGEPVDGNAWDHYAKATTIVPSFDTSEPLAAILNSFHSLTFPPPSPEVRIRDDFRAAVDEILTGLRCVRLRRPTDAAAVGRVHILQLLLLDSAETERRGGRDAEALRLLAAMFALAGDFLKGTAAERIHLDPNPDRFAAVVWRGVLSNHALSSAELESACRLLDRIEENRPTIFEAARIQFESARYRMAYFYPGTADPDEERPALRHFWNWDFKMGELLDLQERDYRAIAALESRPAHEQVAAIEAMEKAIEKARAVETRLNRPTDILLVSSERVLGAATDRSIRDLVRVATALAWYQAEKGSMPGRLADLVPRYLPREPVCAATGAPFPYAAGVLTTPEIHREIFTRNEVVVEWPIRRR